MSPLDIAYISTVEEFGHEVHNGVLDFEHSERQDELIPLFAPRILANMEDPVRVFLVQRRLWGDHLRFHPDSKLKVD